ncbi:3-dehydroquinate dehydratase [Clostridia bacterium]|nr:3-dehydroquinate dehydratase [Clostridia bacterium]
MRLLILNGPNLNMLGIREPDIYGRQTYTDLVAFIEDTADNLGVDVDVRQSNHEGELVEWIQQSLGTADGIVINPAAYTHTSIAILDALKAVGLPAVEVHLSDVSAREPFRQVSYAGMACRETFKGLGFDGYARAMESLVNCLQEKPIAKFVYTAEV